MNIVFVGPPGAGKGTQSARLARILGIPHVASGDLLRAVRAQDTPLGNEAKRYMDAGQLVPDDLTIRIIEERLAQPDAAHGVILDGFPRTLAAGQGAGRVVRAAERRRDGVDLVALHQGLARCGARAHEGPLDLPAVRQGLPYSQRGAQRGGSMRRLRRAALSAPRRDAARSRSSATRSTSTIPCRWSPTTSERGVLADDQRRAGCRDA